MAKPETSPVRDCRYPWTWLHLSSDGSVRPCCFARGELGNLSKAPDVQTIWNGPVAVELRAYIKRNKIHPVCAGAVCKYVQGRGVGD